MARTVYPNTRKPGLMKGLGIAGGVVGVGMMVLYFFVKAEHDTLLMTIGWWVFYSAFMFVEYKLRKIVVDDEEGIIYDQSNKKYPMQIAEISYVTYKESKKGRFRSLFIHDNGIKFMNVATSRANADAIVAQLLASNPSIEVRHANYF